MIDRARLIRELDPRHRDALYDAALDLPTFPLVLHAILPEVGRGKSLAIISLAVEGIVDLERVYGAEAFDGILAEVARVIKSQSGEAIRAEDVITLERVKSNHFLVVLSAPRELDRILPENLERISARLLEAAAGRLAADGAIPYELMNLSIGYALVATSPLVRPERAVYRAVADALRMARHRDESERMRHREEVKRVIMAGEISTVFQPVVALPSLAILGYEALSRGPLKSRFESPAVLFAAAEDHDLVGDLERVCRVKSFLNYQLNATRLVETGFALPAMDLFLNTEPMEYEDPTFTPEALARLAHGHGLAPERLVLEITERSGVASYGDFRSRLDRFRDRGFRIAIDDTGSGYSSLQAVAELKPDFLKVDLALVRDIDRTPIKRDLLGALMDFSRKHDIPVIAEGVESEREYHALVALGVPYAQGFLFARPRPEFLPDEKVVIL